MEGGEGPKPSLKGKLAEKTVPPSKLKGSLTGGTVKSAAKPDVNSSSQLKGALVGRTEGFTAPDFSGISIGLSVVSPTSGIERTVVGVTKTRYGDVVNLLRPDGVKETMSRKKFEERIKEGSLRSK